MCIRDRYMGMQRRGIRLDRKMFIRRLEKFHNCYQINPKALGKGTYGEVYLCRHKFTKEIRAVKTVMKSKMQNVNNFLMEIDCLKNLDHPNIIRLFEWYEDTHKVYLVTEYCSGGELFDKITSVGQFTEKDAADLFVQMMNALRYCNSRGICHKDLKPENFLFASKEDMTLKLIDFGLSQVFSIPGMGRIRMSASVGTVALT
eukprot:TRINITY_DN3685_c0_g1_i8.p2 TRINITY_DN3685_c0_g1~~TRINITY_DN3685_c0_g1_i8.p2  ORF type:complete len:202 (-),score=60.99 TRINITY_DN3685_c0_g1_i8:1021-1626(-)